MSISAKCEVAVNGQQAWIILRSEPGYYDAVLDGHSDAGGMDGYTASGRGCASGPDAAVIPIAAMTATTLFAEDVKTRFPQNGRPISLSRQIRRS